MKPVASVQKPLNKHQLMRAKLMAQKQLATPISAAQTPPPPVTAPGTQTPARAIQHTPSGKSSTQRARKSGSETPIDQKRTRPADNTHRTTNTAHTINDHKRQPAAVDSAQRVPSKQYKDMRIPACKQCGQPFTFSSVEQSQYAARQLPTPVRCAACRNKRKSLRETYKVRRHTKQQVADTGHSNIADTQPIGELRTQHAVSNKRQRLIDQPNVQPATTSAASVSDDVAQQSSDDSDTAHTMHQFDERSLQHMMKQLSGNLPRQAGSAARRADIDSESDINVSDIDSDTGEIHVR